MTDYWRLIDEKYFNENMDKKIRNIGKQCEILKNDILKEKKEEMVFLVVDDILNRNFKEKSFTFSKNEEMNILNKNNFKKHFYISKLLLGNIMQILNNKKTICPKCLNKIEHILIEEYNYKIPKNLNDEIKKKKFLKNEEKRLDNIILNNQLSLCDKCLIKGENVSLENPYLNKIIKVLNKKIAEGKRQQNLLLKELQKNIKILSLQTNYFEISFEFEQIKKYLFYHLIELEGKLLADNIYQIIGENKKTIYIEFIQFTGVYPIEIGELKLLNRFRENSLFRMHNASLKTHQANYVYNDHLKVYIKKTAKINPIFYRKDFFEFSQISNKQKNNLKFKEKFICHHCKYIGTEQFFYSCTNKLRRISEDLDGDEECQVNKNNRTEIFKEFFNIKNSNKFICEKKFCLDCVKKYFFELHEKERRNFVCPFCLVF